jgi:hypothetical protein
VCDPANGGFSCLNAWPDKVSLPTKRAPTRITFGSR